MPLQVYLDSSDFSVLSDPARRTPSHVAVERHLLDLQDRGVIELRFSYAHVVESAPVVKSAIEKARQRLRHIKALCGRKSLLDPFSLLEAEALQAADTSLERLRDARGDGLWVPAEAVRGFAAGQQTLVESKKAQIAAMPSRAARRKEAQRYFDKSGNLRAFAREELQNHVAATVREITSVMPLSKAAAEAVARYLAGTGSAASADHAFTESLADLDTFADWYVSHWDSVTLASSPLRNSGQKLLEVAVEQLAALEPLKQEAEDIGEGSSFRQGLREDLKQQAAAVEERIALLLLQGQGRPPPIQPISTGWETTPGLTMLISVIREFQWVSLSTPGRPRSPMPSDFGDALHAVYLPYVDVFRADSTAANAIRVAKPPFRGLVAPKFLDLPQVVERLTASRCDG